MSTEVTYETDHVSLLRELKMPSALNFLCAYFIITKKRTN